MKHITTQAGRAPSALISIAEQKPLPTEPGRRQSTRNSSRSTQLTGYSSRPNSGQRSSQGLNSQTHSVGHQSPQASKSRRPDNALSSPSSDSAAFESEELAADRMLSIGGLLIRSDEEQPIELPAHVPEDALRQAPVSVKNRLSMTWGSGKIPQVIAYQVSTIHRL